MDCPYCGGLGFFVPNVELSDPQFGRAIVCSCRAAEIDVARQQRLTQLSQLGGLTDCTFASFHPEGHGLPLGRQRNLKMAFEAAWQFAQAPAGWLILKGGYGCGKTHLAAAIANQQLAMGHAAIFVSVPDLLDLLRAAYNPEAETNYAQHFEQIKNSSLLILDDLGSQSNTDWAQEKLYQLLNHRYNFRLPTVITTNEELEAIEIRVRSRMMDPGLSQIVHIAAPDFRGTGLDAKHSDLSTLNLHNDKRFENFDLRERELPKAEVENLRRALENGREFAENPAGWLVFQSIAFGNGKTHLAAAIANELANGGQTVLFVVVPDLLDYLRAAFNPATNARYDKRFDEVKLAPVLVLDDLGTESATAWAREKLYQIFNYRYNARLPTIITTATPIDEIDPRLAARMLDGGRCTFFVLEVPSYRGGAKPKQPTRKRPSR